MARMRYTDFRGEFLRYLYGESLKSTSFLDFRDLADRYEIPFETGYLRAIHGDLKRPGYIEGPDAFDDEGVAGRLTGHGLEYIENQYKDDLPQGPSTWRELRSNLTEKDVPASDRIVRLDHNSRDYQSVNSAIADLIEGVRVTNSETMSEADRSRLTSALSAAAALWSSVELKVIQIKVGIVLALEDAGKAISVTAKAVAVGVIVDSIKSLVKTQTGIDLDHI